MSKLLNRKGFTIIEVLVVVSIIGILASAVVVAFSGGAARARDTRRVGDLNKTLTALLLVREKEGEFPNGISDWDDLESSVKDADVGVARLPNDPLLSSGHQSYVYAVSTDKQSVILQATLEQASPSILSNSYNGSTNGYTVAGQVTLNCDQSGSTENNNYCVKY